MEFTTRQLIEISLIDYLPKNQQFLILRCLLSQCDRIYAGNPLYSREKLEALPIAIAIYIAKELTEHE